MADHRDARSWYYPDGWPLLDRTACAILNMSARRLFPTTEPTPQQLEVLARGYAPGATVSGLVTRHEQDPWDLLEASD